MSQPPADIITIDCQYRAPGKASAYLIVSEGRAAFVDNNTRYAVPHLLAALEQLGLKPEQVDYAIITHVHLDHAGGSAALLQACPNATLLAHPKAARHMINPSRLIAGSIQVYGDAEFHRLYGEIEPIDASRVRIMDDGETLAWAGRDLHFFYTPGHASHHFCIYDRGSNAVFTGDSFGIGRTNFVRPGKPYLVCSSTPVEFDAAEFHRSVDKIAATGADWAYVGHFGVFASPPDFAEQLHRSIAQHGDIVDGALSQGLEGSALAVFCEDGVRAAMVDHLSWAKVDAPDDELAWIGSDIVLNAQGLVAAVGRIRKKAASGA